VERCACALSKYFNLCGFHTIAQRKEVDSLQVQARAVNTALNRLVIGIGITGTRKNSLTVSIIYMHDVHKDVLCTFEKK